jgi:hydrogenase/urease accessory protein HupE
MWSFAVVVSAVSHRVAALPAAILLLMWGGAALAHGVADGDAAFVAHATGAHPLPFLYLGAKHMVTGVDHLLFLVAVVLFLDRMTDVVLYVTMFSLGHSATLVSGVLAETGMDPRPVDAMIGLSIVYKALDNSGGLRAVFPGAPDSRIAVLAFGLLHGLGLATKLQDLSHSADGLLPNLLAFNAGVELGQILALWIVLTAIALWRYRPWFATIARAANIALIVAGLGLAQGHLAGWLFAEV